MRLFTTVPQGGVVNCQTIISVYACVRYFEHEHMFISYLLCCYLLVV